MQEVVLQVTRGDTTNFFCLSSDGKPSISWFKKRIAVIAGLNFPGEHTSAHLTSLSFLKSSPLSSVKVHSWLKTFVGQSLSSKSAS